MVFASKEITDFAIAAAQWLSCGFAEPADCPKPYHTRPACE
jgi:hypothetical protein